MSSSDMSTCTNSTSSLFSSAALWSAERNAMNGARLSATRIADASALSSRYFTRLRPMKPHPPRISHVPPGGLDMVEGVSGRRGRGARRRVATPRARAQCPLAAWRGGDAAANRSGDILLPRGDAPAARRPRSPPRNPRPPPTMAAARRIMSTTSPSLGDERPLYRDAPASPKGFYRDAAPRPYNLMNDPRVFRGPALSSVRLCARVSARGGRPRAASRAPRLFRARA